MNHHTIFPDASWNFKNSDEPGLSSTLLTQLTNLIGGRGCVVKNGYMIHQWGDVACTSDIASAFKPVLSTLLLFAVQEKRIHSVDDLVKKFEPDLEGLNDGKDATMNWRHLANQTSGYGLVESPGEAYAYNDYAIALYHDVLTSKVFKCAAVDVFNTRLGEFLQFEDPISFEAFGRHDRPGRVAISMRDFARFGMFYLNLGFWKNSQLLSPDLIKMAIGSPISATLPVTCGNEAAMLPGQRTVGGGKNITSKGPGCYSFNWWLNTPLKNGQRLFPALPEQAYHASGHGHRRTLWIFPSHHMIICWNEARFPRVRGDFHPDLLAATRIMGELLQTCI